MIPLDYFYLGCVVGGLTVFTAVCIHGAVAKRKLLRTLSRHQATESVVPHQANLTESYLRQEGFLIGVGICLDCGTKWRTGIKPQDARVNLHCPNCWQPTAIFQQSQSNKQHHD